MAEPQLLQRTCPLCERDNRHEPRSHWSRDEWTIRDCPECRFVYLENAVDYASLAGDFRWTSTAPLERQRRLNAEPITTRLRHAWKALRRQLLFRHKCANLAHARFEPGPVLDVGCGGGKFLGLLDERYQLYGIEIDPVAVVNTTQRLATRGVQIVQSDALTGFQQLPEAFFSGIMMKCYLEHETAPGPVLRAAVRTLRPGGQIIIKVPNFQSWNRQLQGQRWSGFRFPDHVNYFTPDTLMQLVRRCGLEVTRCSWLDRNPVNDNMYLIAGLPSAATQPTPMESSPSPSQRKAA